MKVEISSNGNLVLTPETSLENYALDKWYEGYNSKGKETLTVNLFVVNDSEPCKASSSE